MSKEEKEEKGRGKNKLKRGQKDQTMGGGEEAKLTFVRPSLLTVPSPVLGGALAGGRRSPFAEELPGLWGDGPKRLLRFWAEVKCDTCRCLRKCGPGGQNLPVHQAIS